MKFNKINFLPKSIFYLVIVLCSKSLCMDNPMENQNYIYYDIKLNRQMKQVDAAIKLNNMQEKCIYTLDKINQYLQKENDSNFIRNTIEVQARLEHFKDLIDTWRHINNYTVVITKAVIDNEKKQEKDNIEINCSLFSCFSRLYLDEENHKTNIFDLKNRVTKLVNNGSDILRYILSTFKETSRVTNNENQHIKSIKLEINKFINNSEKINSESFDIEKKFFVRQREEYTPYYIYNALSHLNTILSIEIKLINEEIKLINEEIKLINEDIRL